MFEVGYQVVPIEFGTHSRGNHGKEPKIWKRSLLSPAHSLQDSFRLVQWHPADSKRSDLRSSPQPLETDCDFPPLFLWEDEDVALALLIPDICS